MINLRYVSPRFERPPVHPECLVDRLLWWADVAKARDTELVEVEEALNKANVPQLFPETGVKARLDYRVRMLYMEKENFKAAFEAAKEEIATLKALLEQLEGDKP